jgi:hypothetical protein
LIGAGITLVGVILLSAIAELWLLENKFHTHQDSI